jgi:pantoate--beta-alanine ligase
MKVIRKLTEMQRTAESLRLQGKRIALVPTMGFLHEGHLSLMREGRKRADVVVASVFVNPTQFGPQEDLEAYPRDFDRDEKLMRGVGVDFVFYPTVEEIYPEGYQTYVIVERVTRGLCGASRPVHFRGVATVVTKLFNVVKPHVALFGDKDFQQRVVIQRMVEDLNFDVEVLGCPTVRESDGLAMSSRNAYLSPQERGEAPALKRSLEEARTLFQAGERRAQLLMDKVRLSLSLHPLIKLDYLHVCDSRTLEDVAVIRKEAVLVIAAFLGKTRLIDNIVLVEPAERTLSAARHPEQEREGKSIVNS